MDDLFLGCVRGVGAGAAAAGVLDGEMEGSGAGFILESCTGALVEEEFDGVGAAGAERAAFVMVGQQWVVSAATDDGQPAIYNLQSTIYNRETVFYRSTPLRQRLEPPGAARCPG